MNKLYDLKDVSIIPAAVSDVYSRKECNPNYDNDKLPVFNAPMSVLMNSVEDIEKLYKSSINLVIPRSFTIDERLQFLKDFPLAFIAIGMGEMDEVSAFVSENNIAKPKILVDIANGHMKKLIDMCADMKKRFPKMEIMAGNIANPETLLAYEKAGIDYVRCSVGSGFGCITTPSTGVFYPLGSLIGDCRKLKNEHNLKIKIIADGGIDAFSKICKCLALGADYVMCGKMVAQCEDINTSGVFISEEDGNKMREYFGMASHKGQEAMKLTKLKTEEGRCVNIDIKYTLEGLTTLISDYIRSSMSYCNCRNINEFVSGNVKIAFISENSSVIFDRN